MRLISIYGFFMVFLLSSCGGGVSGENGSDPFGSNSTPETFTITLAILEQQCGVTSEPSFTAGDTLCVQATLKQGDSFVSGEIISFSAGLGRLSVETKLTDNNGVAPLMTNTNHNALQKSVLIDMQNNFMTHSPSTGNDQMILLLGVHVRLCSEFNQWCLYLCTYIITILMVNS